MYISGKTAEALRHFDRLVFRDSHVLLNRDIFRISVSNKLRTFHGISGEHLILRITKIFATLQSYEIH